MRPVDPRLLHSLQVLLFDRHLGRGCAATGETLRAELAAVGLEVGHVRRVQEAIKVLRRRGVPICATSARGYWLPTEAEDIERSLAETTRRAVEELELRRCFRRALLEFRGQRRLSEAA